MSKVVVAACAPAELAQLDELCADFGIQYSIVDVWPPADDDTIAALEAQGELDLLVTGNLVDIEQLDASPPTATKQWLALCKHNAERAVEIAAALGRAGANHCLDSNNWEAVAKLIKKSCGIAASVATPKLDLVKPLRTAPEPITSAAPESEPPAGLIGRCEAMQEVYSRIRKVGPTKSTVLIRGETGTGKELIARAIHNSSDRAKKPFVAVNCAAIPETLIESELFGHEKGAFTGAAGKRVGLIEEAEGGTLFLDEIGELPSDAQARLLRFIQESEVRSVGSNKSRKVDVRLIAATHRDLQKQAKSGEFRADLYYRINVFRIFLPLLKDRGDDIFEIAQHLVERAALRHSKPNLTLTPDAVEAINLHSWEGNVRELENTIERAAIMTNDVLISARDLEIELKPEFEARLNSTHPPHPRTNTPSHSNDPLTLDEAADKAITSMSRPGHSNMHFSEPQAGVSLEDYFQQFVIENQEHMNETQLAKMLGISRKCLWERRQRYGIPRKTKSNRTKP